MNKRFLARRLVFPSAWVVAGFLLTVICASAQTLYYGSSSAIQSSNTLQSIVTNGTGNALLFTAAGGSSVNRCTALAVDSLNSNLFLVDGLSNNVWRLNLSGGNLIPVNRSLAFASGIALDPVRQKIYYTTTSTLQGNNTVQRMDYTGQNNVTVFVASGIDGNGVQRCTSIAVDSLNALIFIGDAGNNTIWSMSLKGGNLAKVATRLPGAPLDLAVDPQNQLVYVTTSSAAQSGNTIQRISYNNSNSNVVFTATGFTANGVGNGVARCTSLDLDLPNARIYFSDAGTQSLWSLTTSGGNLAIVKNPLTPSTVKKVRLFTPSTLGTNSHLSYSNVVMTTPNLLAYWPFSPATQANSLGDGYPGNFVGTAAVGAAGSGPALFGSTSNTAVILSGLRSYVTTSLVGGLTTNGNNADQATIIAWFNLATLPSTTGRIFTIAGESMNGNDLDLQIETDNKIKFFTDAGSSTVVSNALTATNLNTWMFVAATFSSNITRSIYVNGALAATSVPGGLHNPAAAGQFAMGESLVFTGRYFQGSLDEIAIFNRALTPTEISNLYDAGAGLSFVNLNIASIGTNAVVTWADPQSYFFLQSSHSLSGVYTNVPGAISPYSQALTNTNTFFRLKAH